MFLLLRKWLQPRIDGGNGDNFEAVRRQIELNVHNARPIRDAPGVIADREYIDGFNIDAECIVYKSPLFATETKRFGECPRFMKRALIRKGMGSFEVRRAAISPRLP